jgi:hypothetical protein
MTTYSPRKCNRSFGFLLHLHSWRLSQTRKELESGSKLSGLRHAFFIVGLLFNPEDKFLLPDRRLIFNGLNSVISQKMEIFITTALTTSNPNYPGCLLHEKQKEKNIK